METKEITMLRQEIADLRSRMDDLVKAQNNDREQAIKLIEDSYKTAYQSIKNIHDYLWPLVNKVFPKWAASQQQITDFMKGRNPIDGEEKSL